VAWSYGAFASSKLLTLITSAILARVLTPVEFGIVGFATVGITYLSVAQDLGLGGALIYERERPDAASHVVFSWNLVLGVVARRSVASVACAVNAVSTPYATRFTAVTGQF
jgi:PST family polysaccharide transporter